MKKIYKFVITGGPCAGKTTALNILRKALTERGFKVLTAPESATEIFSIGLSLTETPQLTIQDLILKKMLHSENFVENIANTLDFNNENIIIFCDRGILDSKAYTPYEDFITVLDNNGLNEEEAIKRYDAVFHLVTAANGAEEFYTLENNSARFETAEEALALDLRTLNAWQTHPNLYVFDNSTNFDEKMNRLISKVIEIVNIN